MATCCGDPGINLVVDVNDFVNDVDAPETILGLGAVLETIDAESASHGGKEEEGGVSRKHSDAAKEFRQVSGTVGCPLA